MTKVEQSIEVNVPVQTAYNQWTQFEEFPQFMEGVDSVSQLTDSLTHWTVTIAGQTREFDAEITEQKPDERIAWRSLDGLGQAGVVTFHRLDESTTRIMLQMEFQPEGLVEKAGDMLGLAKQRAKGDLNRFKEFIERRQVETGAFRGQIDNQV
ncbi:MAG: hypothetical protein QOE64_383 [Frankiales bacterium]|nr:hypothetical protein [Frankiales bacterium]